MQSASDSPLGRHNGASQLKTYRSAVCRPNALQSMPAEISRRWLSRLCDSYACRTLWVVFFCAEDMCLSGRENWKHSCADCPLQTGMFAVDLTKLDLKMSLFFFSCRISVSALSSRQRRPDAELQPWWREGRMCLWTSQLALHWYGLLIGW